MTRPVSFINKAIFTSGGVLGRKDYFFALLKLVSYFIVGTLIFSSISIVLTKFHPAFEKLLISYLVVGLIITFYYKYVNAFKRMRDIRGLTHNQIYWQIGYVLFSCIPILGLLPALALFFIPGKVK